MWNERDLDSFINWILDIEKKLPVERWSIDGVDIWPLIRIRLNFLIFLAPASDGEASTPQPAPKNSIVKQIAALFKFITRPFGKAPVIGADFIAHRALFNNKMVDKYFDPIFDSLEERHRDLRGVIVEYQAGSATKPYYKEERVVRLHEFRILLQKIGMLRYKLSKPKYNLERYDEFLDILRSEGLDPNYYSKEYVGQSIATIKSLKWFWKKLFRKTGAKVAIGLCYYTEPLYAMILAARELNVVSVDMQHGGQGTHHLAYTRFSKLPQSGSYNMMPHYFWCWDDASANPINDWIKKLKSGHKVIQKGHPWLDYMQALQWPQLDHIHNLVMITLQSYDTSKEAAIIEDYIMAVIKSTSREFKWFVRLHPRQSHLRNELKEELKQNGILEDVDVDNANDLPMPAILGRAAVHITKSSGSAIEAELMGVPNVIIDEMGGVMFDEMIKSGRAQLYLGKDPADLVNVIRIAATRRKNVALTGRQNEWDFLLTLQ